MSLLNHCNPSGPGSCHIQELSQVSPISHCNPSGPGSFQIQELSPVSLLKPPQPLRASKLPHPGTQPGCIAKTPQPLRPGSSHMQELSWVSPINHCNPSGPGSCRIQELSQPHRLAEKLLHTQVVHDPTGVERNNSELVLRICCPFSDMVARPPHNFPPPVHP